ncbi:MAG: DUF2461 domain-containing protein [Bacteroidetes bacterium]|nr:DUF2461 domain-containing protein [Bacteroidota bacterium]
MKALIKSDFFDFFKKLAANNNKDWFDANKKWYEEAVKLPFELLVSELIQAMEKRDKEYGMLQPKDCIFRINRDIRFSSDKTPYKTNRSALMAPGGRKHMSGKGFYLELGPESCGLYAGAYMPAKEDLYQMRLKIKNQSKKFRQILEDKTFVKTFGEIQGEKQKRLDTEFREAAENEPILFHKQLYIQHEFSEKEITGDDAVKRILDVAKLSEPFVNFLELK